jgi:hypothetical protein
VTNGATCTRFDRMLIGPDAFEVSNLHRSLSAQSRCLRFAPGTCPVKHRANTTRQDANVRMHYERPEWRIATPQDGRQVEQGPLVTFHCASLLLTRSTITFQVVERILHQWTHRL